MSTSFSISGGKVIDLTSSPVSFKEVATPSGIKKAMPQSQPELTLPVLSSELSQLSSKNSQDQIEVLVTLSENAAGLLRTTQSPFTEATSFAPAAVDALRQSRVTAFAEVNSAVGTLGGRNLEQFWITPTARISLPLQSLKALAALPGVLSITPVETKIPPPAGIATGRQLMHSDYIKNLNLPSRTRIGLQDGHLWKGHALLSGADIRYYDCTIASGSGCAVATPNISGPNYRHATASASIISGTTALGVANAGVTGHPIDAYNVYDLNTAIGGGEGLNLAALSRSWQQGLLNGNKIMVGEVQLCPTGAAATQLNSAAISYSNSGNLVVAAAGNYGNGNSEYVLYCSNAPTSTYVASPGQANGVIAVGSVNYSSLQTEVTQGIQNTNSGTIKPDVQGPTCLDAAYTTTSNGLASFCGTSGSTPFIGGLAALMYGLSSDMTTNRVAAYLYAAGNRQGPAFYSPQGAGLADTLFNGVDSDTIVGNVSLPAQGTTIQVALPSLNRSYKTVRAAISWRDVGSLHDDVDLVLVPPVGSGLGAGSYGIDTIWEKASITNNPTVGAWTLSITTYTKRTCQSLCPINTISYSVIGDR